MELLELSNTFNTINKYIDWEIKDYDFIEVENIIKIILPMSGKNSKWYIINPFKLKNVKHRLLVSEADKEQILSATKLIISISQSLAAESTFKQRIAYFKAFLPSSLFQLKREKA